MKKLFTLIVLSLFFVALSAQNGGGLAVSEFRLLNDDLTANLHGTMVYDFNGEKCALIKVETTQRGFSFDVGALGVVKIVEQPGEIWLYVPEKIKRITISHPQLGVLRDYELGVQVNKGRTYLLKLTTGTIATVVQKIITSQYLQFNIEPAEALVEVDGEIWNTIDGVARKFLPLGDYEYRVYLKDYAPQVGKVKLNDVNQKSVINVKLSSSCGWIEIGDFDELRGAKVYIDDAYIGKAPIKSGQLSAGKHNLKIIQDMYHIYEEEVEVIAQKTYRMAPYLKAKFAFVTIQAAEGVEIWVNGEKKAVALWKGKLEDGEYSIEARRTACRTVTTTCVIDSKAESKKLIKLDSPTPIGGKLDVTVLPDGADVYLEGKLVGQTPLFLQKVLVGNRIVTVKKEGYASQQFEINVVENQTANVSGNLKKE